MCHGDNSHFLTSGDEKAPHLCGHLPPKPKPRSRGKPQINPKGGYIYKISGWCSSKLKITKGKTEKLPRQEETEEAGQLNVMGHAGWSPETEKGHEIQTKDS